LSTEIDWRRAPIVNSTRSPNRPSVSDTATLRSHVFATVPGSPMSPPAYAVAGKATGAGSSSVVGNALDIV